MGKIYKDDVGVLILVDCDHKLAGATDITLHVKKPSGTEVNWAGALHNTEYLSYTTTPNDLDQAGTYLVQPSLTLGSWTGRGETDVFTVYDHFENG